MIKLTYTPWKPTFADASEPSPVQELTMTIGNGVSWDEATREFHNFLRAAGYVIPYDIEWYEDVDDDLCTPLQKLTDWEEKYRPEELGVVKGFDQLEAKRNKCNDHPDAPHGMDRSASHNAGRYVCECESWEPEKREWVYLTEEEMLHIVTRDGMQLAEAIEAKLKQKNTP